MAKNSLLSLALKTTALTVLATVLADGAAASNRQVGVASGATTRALGTPPNADARLLDTGTKMYYEEKVVTDPTGRAQLLFEDGSSMTIGPKSDLVIDRFVYDPDSRTGEMAVSLTKGIVRFVGGRISKKRAVQFKTPVGTMGIRGGIAVISVEPAGGIEVDFLFGQEMTLEVNGTVQTTTTPGTFISVASAGSAPSEPQRRSPEALNQRLQAFEAGSSGTTSDGNAPESAGQSAAPSQGQAARQIQVQNQTAQIDTQVAELASFERQQEELAPAQFESPSDLPNGENVEQERDVLDVPPPRPEADRPQDFVTATPPSAGDTPLAPGPTTETVDPVSPTTVTPVSPPPSSGTPSTPVAFSRTYSGFAFRGNTSFATAGANSTTSVSTLGDRRFTTISVSGDDQATGGVLTGSTTAGNYQLFYPSPTGSSPTSIASCHASLDCTTKIAGNTPSSVSGEIQHSNDPFFVGYNLTVDGEKEVVAVGTAFTGTMPTGATTYKIFGDPFFTDALPYARSSVAGLASNIEPTGIVYWDSTGGTKPFVSSSFEIDSANLTSNGGSTTTTNGSSLGSVIIGRINGSSSAEYVTGFGYGMVDGTGTTKPQIYKAGAFSADTGGGNDFFGTSSPDAFVLNSVEDADSSNGVSAGATDLTGVGTTYYPVAPVVKSATATVSGSDRTFQNSPTNLIGFTGGAGTVATTPESFVTTTATGNTTFLTISGTADTLDASVTVTGSGGTTVTATTSGAVSAYVADNAFASQLTGGSTSLGAEANIEGVVATHGSNSQNFTLCSTCTFLEWGFWSTHLGDNDVIINMASWVAGISATTAQISGVTDGATATYTGKAIGSVIEAGGATALKTGAFSVGITFNAAAAENVTLNNFTFDGQTFTGSTTFDGTSTNGFSVSDTVGGKTLDMRGALFGSDSANPPPELGGDFKITGTGYNAGGVYAGHK